MRVTGGRARGRRLSTPRGLDIRPTSDRVREAVFDLIGQDLEGAKVLDLFAGTGSLGIEALSRGASWAVFVDRSQKSIELVKRNLRGCGFEELGCALRGDLARGLPKRACHGGKKMSLVFIDPPYGRGLVIPIMVDLSTKGVLETPARVVVETRKNEILPETVGMLHGVMSRTYGETKIHIFSLEGDR